MLLNYIKFCKFQLFKVIAQEKVYIMELQEIPPEPIHDFKPFEEDELPKGVPYILSSRFIRKALRKVQKHSIWPLTVYFPLHAVNTLIVPTISPEGAPDDVLMMVRELLPSYTNSILASAIGLHVGCGLIIRIWDLVNKWNVPKRRKMKVTDDKQRQSQRSIGLIGGFSGYFIGINRNFSYSPQVLSGYILTPIILYHMTLMKWMPKKVGVDVDFTFVKWILQNNKWSVKWVGGIVPLSALIAFSTYHIIAGLCQYAKVKKLETRKKISTLIFAMTMSGLLGIWRLARSSPVVGIDGYKLVVTRMFLR